jgi:1,4-dihydroxy-2-naphthoate octaprenyltransferase
VRGGRLDRPRAGGLLPATGTRPGSRARRSDAASRRPLVELAPTALSSLHLEAAAPGTKLSEWVVGARPRTLPVAVVPVVVGSSVAAAVHHFAWWRSLLCLVVSLAIQVGTNYANDYSDGVRGTDAERVGPVRLVAGGLASPPAVRRAAWLSFAAAGIAGLALSIVTTPYLVAVGAACIGAGWLYTGGPRPYGYAGLGELFVFVFFGLVAVVGTVYVNASEIPAVAVVAAVPVGLLAVALLVVNNLRDLANDARAGKRTLAVRLGDGPTRVLFEACVLAPFAGAGAVAYFRPGALLALVALVLAVTPVRRVHRGATGPELVGVLSKTGRLGLVFGLLLALGVLV